MTGLVILTNKICVHGSLATDVLVHYNGQTVNLAMFLQLQGIASVPALLAMSTGYQMIDPIIESSKNPFPITKNIRGIVCKFLISNVQHEYSSKPKKDNAVKHAEEFIKGIGNWDLENGKRYVNAIMDFMNDLKINNEGVNEGTNMKNGKYKQYSGTHFYNKNTKLWVFVREDGVFCCAWRLSPDQMFHLINDGNVK